MKHTLLLLVWLISSGALAQTKTSSKTAVKPKPEAMSHDFLVAGRRALPKISWEGDVCDHLCYPEDHQAWFEALAAIQEADVQHNNATDKRALTLLKEYSDVAFDKNECNIHSMLKMPPPEHCQDGARATMFDTCKKELEQAFDNGILPEKSECKRLAATSR
jgi:hypothetical protein